MRALGVELIEHGDDFQAAREFAHTLAREKSLHLVPSFHPLLVAGVATYSLELGGRGGISPCSRLCRVFQCPVSGRGSGYDQDF
jgi:threonine dehydratase